MMPVVLNFFSAPSLGQEKIASLPNHKQIMNANKLSPYFGKVILLNGWQSYFNKEKLVCLHLKTTLVMKTMRKNIFIITLGAKMKGRSAKNETFRLLDKKA